MRWAAHLAVGKVNFTFFAVANCNGVRGQRPAAARFSPPLQNKHGVLAGVLRA